MIEVSMVEIALFAWAVIATGQAFKYKSDARSSDVFIKLLLENKEARDEIVEQYEQFTKGQRS